MNDFLYSKLINDEVDQMKLYDDVNERHSPDGKKVLQIFRSPNSDIDLIRCGDDLAIIYCKEDGLGDLFQHKDFANHAETMEKITADAVALLPIYVYKHSNGFSIQTTPFDVSFGDDTQGVAYITQEKIDKVLVTDIEAIDNFDQFLKKQINDEVEDYNLFLQGEVFSYILFDRYVDKGGFNHLTKSAIGQGYIGTQGTRAILSETDSKDWDVTVDDLHLRINKDLHLNTNKNVTQVIPGIGV